MHGRCGDRLESADKDVRAVDAQLMYHDITSHTSNNDWDTSHE